MEETRALLSIWGETNIQSQLDGAYRNRSLYEKIALEMGELELKRTWQQCRTRIKNLTYKYRKVGMS